MRQAVIKKRIEKAFSRHADTYDIHSALQREVAEELIGMIKDKGRIGACLDVGCGTGFLTKMLKEGTHGSPLYGLDISHRMIEVAGNKLSHIPKTYLIQADAEGIPFKDSSFDLVASNLTYQWMPDPMWAFSEARRVIKKGGRFLSSIIGHESLKELRESYRLATTIAQRDGLPPFVDFPKSETILDTMERAGFSNISIKETFKIRYYEDMWELLRALKSIGAGNPHMDGDTSLARGRVLRSMAESYRDRFFIEDNGCRHVYATYHIIFVYGEG